MCVPLIVVRSVRRLIIYEYGTIKFVVAVGKLIHDKFFNVIEYSHKRIHVRSTSFNELNLHDVDEINLGRYKENDIIIFVGIEKDFLYIFFELSFVAEFQFGNRNCKSFCFYMYIHGKVLLER